MQIFIDTLFDGDNLNSFTNLEIAQYSHASTLPDMLSFETVDASNTYILPHISIFQLNTIVAGTYNFTDYYYIASKKILPPFYINNTKLIPTRSGILAFDPNTDVELKSSIDDIPILAIGVDRHFIGDIASQMEYKGNLSYKTVLYDYSITLQNLFTNIISEIIFNNSESMMLKSYEMLIAAYLIRMMNNDSTRKEKQVFIGKSYIDRAIEYIQSSFCNDLSIKDICTKVNISQYHFLREFKKQIGLTPYQYLLHLRLAKAKHLVEDEDIPITQIASSCGFNSISHFSTNFKKYFGVSPSKLHEHSSPTQEPA